MGAQAYTEKIMEELAATMKAGIRCGADLFPRGGKN